MNITCPHCGAEVGPETTCQDRFNHCLVLDYEQAVFGEVHHLTVVCYMLQHNQYSRRGRMEAVQLLAGCVEGGLSPRDAIQRNRSALDRGKRTWSLTKEEKRGDVEQVAWTRTIADIRLGDADTYCADVALWAKSILLDIREHEVTMREGRVAETRQG